MIFFSDETRVVVQGITGRSGRNATREMLRAGTRVTCGVTPGKSGEEVAGLPVFDSVAEAKAHDPGVNTSVILVPPLLVLDAALEAIAAGIRLLVIVTENVPIKDAAFIVATARAQGVVVVGPSSVGIITPGKGKLGLIGSDPDVYTPGTIGVVSKSGGMCAETSRLLTREGLGQSTVVGIGGDVIIGTTFVDALRAFQEDEGTAAVVLYGEIGGAYEEEAAAFIKRGGFTKPVIAFIAGRFAESLGKGLPLGHAGAIVEDGGGGAEEKKRALREAGVFVADYHDEIPSLVKAALKKRGG